LVGLILIVLLAVGAILNQHGNSVLVPEGQREREDILSA